MLSGTLLGGTNWEAAQSQPIADRTLGNERSVVVPLESNAPSDRISGRAQRGNNLFHISPNLPQTRRLVASKRGDRGRVLQGINSIALL